MIFLYKMDEDKLYIKNVVPDVIYNFVVEMFIHLKLFI